MDSFTDGVLVGTAVTIFGIYAMDHWFCTCGDCREARIQKYVAKQEAKGK